MLYFLAAMAFSAVATLAVAPLARRYGIVDAPTEARKKHGRVVPLLGGAAIFLAFWAVMAYVAFFTDLLGVNLSVEKLVWVFCGSAVLMVVGYFDDRYKISPWTRLVFVVFAIAAVILGGVGIDRVTNPFGGVWYLDFWRWDFGEWGAVLPFADLIVLAWILGLTYTTKILDGLDGLSTGIGSIGAVMIFFIANGERWHQPDVALVALIFAGACLGFLPFNFSPARIFLGEGGSMFLGFMLGVLSVISGGKFATALLVMAVPILDLAYVMWRRVRRGQRISEGDREHLHFRLTDAGFTQRQAVLFFYAVAIFFGLTTLFLQSLEKVLALCALAVVVVAAEAIVGRGKKI